MTEIRALIVDDEPLAIAGMRMRLNGHPDVRVVGACLDGYTAVEAIQDLEPDVVFLDVQMPGLDGFGVLQALAPLPLPAVVFVTAYDEYALRAFRVHAVDYIVKPADDAIVAEALDRVRARVAASGQAADPAVEALLGSVEGPAANSSMEYLHRILVRTAERVYFVKTAEIVRIVSADNYLKVITGSGQHVIRATLREIEARLDPETFVRIHRQVIVNRDQLQEIRIVSPGEYVAVLKDGTTQRVGRRYRDQVLNRGF